MRGDTQSNLPGTPLTPWHNWSPWCGPLNGLLAAPNPHLLFPNLRGQFEQAQILQLPATHRETVHRLRNSQGSAGAARCLRATDPVFSCCNTAEQLLSRVPVQKQIPTSRVCRAATPFWMRPGGAWTLYLLAVFVGGPLLAPWVYTVGQFAGDVPLFSSLASAPFHRYLTRCMMAVAIVGLWPLFKALGLSSWQELGLAPLKPNLHRLICGFGLGFVSLAIIMVISLASHGRAWHGDRDMGAVLRHLVNAGLAAIVVSPLEEVLFRGGLFGALRKEHGWKPALVVSSLVYAAVHFLDRARWTEPVTWSSGVTLLGQMFVGAGGSAALVPRFLTLCVAGVVLGIAYQWTGNLWCSVGLHAGWIFWLKSYGFLTRDVNGAAVWLWGTGRLIDGWLAVFVMLGVLAGLWTWLTRRSQRVGNGCCTGQSGTRSV